MLEMFVKGYIPEGEEHAVKNIFERNGDQPYSEVFLCIIPDNLILNARSGKNTIGHKKGDQDDKIG